MPVLVAIDDDRSIVHLVTRCFEGSGVEVVPAGSAQEGLAAVRASKPDAVLLDIVLPDATGLEIFADIRSFDRKLPIIFMTSGGTSDTVIEAIQLGAYDYVQKPLDVAALRDLVLRAIESRRLMSVDVAFPASDDVVSKSDLMIGRSPRILEVYKSIARCAAQSVPVLIRGESGTGKELVARAIYQHGERADRPFLAVNCAALSESLLESELFGHEKGAFTGADRRRIGKFEQCDGGTIFLDEVGDMSISVQAKVLRLLQQQEFERVGGTETIKTDVRIISATNRPLEEMCEDKSFRLDLLYRLNGYTVSLPPLRERGDDTLLLLEHFITRSRTAMGLKDFEGIAPDAVDMLLRYAWPGNIRELESAVREALVDMRGPVLISDFLPAKIRAAVRRSPEGATGSGGMLEFVDRRIGAASEDLYAETIEFVERQLFERVLSETSGNQTQAARILGITRGKLRNRIQSFGIELEGT